MTIPVRLNRSQLSVPASSMRFIEKAVESAHSNVKWLAY